MKNFNKGFSLSAIILAIAAFLGLGTPLAMPNMATSTPDQSEYLSAQQTLELAQKAITSRLYGLNLQCIDFDGIRENGVVTYNVFVKASASCSSSILKEPASVTIDLNTGAASVTVGHPVTPPATQVNPPHTSATCPANQMLWGNTCKPYLAVTSPKQGDIVQKTQPFQVTWASAPELGDQLINVYTETEIGSCKIGSASGFKGVLEVTLIDKPGCVIPLGAHHISLEAVDRVTGKVIVTNATGYTFTVNPASVSLPTITIISPNGSEIIQAGQQYLIRWNTSYISDSNVQIYLDDDSKNCTGLLGCWNDYGIGGAANTGTYTWDTTKKMFGDAGPNSTPVLPGTTYRIKICNESKTTCDTSDTYFSIVR